MKATGIIRRVDDLGRIVIPKPIRTAMKIEAGTPLEIFLTADGGVCFKKYHLVDDGVWTHALSVLECVLKCEFAVLDETCTVRACTSPAYAKDVVIIQTPIVVDGNLVGYLSTPNDCENLPTAINICTALFQ